MHIFLIIILIFLQSCGGVVDATTPVSQLYRQAKPVTISSYQGDAMEPFITRDGKFLLFNNSNDAQANTNLHYAERLDDLTFNYKGEIANVNSSALDGVASIDKSGNIYFVSTRSYDKTLATIYRGKFNNGAVSGVELLPNISLKKFGKLNFDVEINANGDTLYFVDGVFSGGVVPDRADIVIANKTGEGFARSAKSGEVLKHINTSALEYAPCISANGLTLLFTYLQKGGKPAIYISNRENVEGAFDSPVRLDLGEFIIEAPTFTPDENAIYYHQKVGKNYQIFRASK